MTQDLGDRPWYQDWPKGVPRMLDIPEIGLGEMLRQTAGEFPDHKAVVFLDSVISYRQLDEMVDRMATALARLGLEKGDVLAMMLPNSHQFVITFYACQRLGVTVTAINPTYKALEIKHQLTDSGAKVMVVLDAVYAEVDKVISQTGIKFLIGTNVVDLCGFPGIKIWLGKLLKKIPTGQMPGHTLKFTDLMQTEPDPPSVKVDPAEDIAVLQYTGGTTGIPKGAMLTAKNLVANCGQCQAWLGKGGVGTGFVGVLPLFHIYAMTVTMNFAVRVGGFQLLFPQPPVNYHEWAKDVVKWGKGSELIMPGVAILFNKINTTPGLEKYDLSCLKRGVSGAGPLPREVQLTFEEKFNCPVVEGYGLSEASPVTHCNPVWGERKLGSIGLALPSTDCKIMDIETGETQLGLGPDQIGELCVKGPQVMKGYLNRPEESARALRDGWLYTGDIAYMDEQGWVFIMDRARDLVKIKGFSVFPKEVEDYMYSHPDILEVAVVGLPHPTYGETLKAYVVLQPGCDKDEATCEAEIIAWCKENMTKYKVPSVIEFRAELPKTMVGKVLRRVLREEEREKEKANQTG